MTRLLIGQSYYLRFDAKLWRQMQPYPPLQTLIALLIFAAVLLASLLGLAQFVLVSIASRLLLRRLRAHG